MLNIERLLIRDYRAVKLLDMMAVRLPGGTVVTYDEMARFRNASDLLYIVEFDLKKLNEQGVKLVRKIPELGELLGCLEKGGADRIKKFLRPVKESPKADPGLSMESFRRLHESMMSQPYPPPQSLGRRLGVGTNLPGYTIGVDTATTTASNPLGSISFPFGITGNTT